MSKVKVLLVAHSPSLPTGTAAIVRSIFEALQDDPSIPIEICQLALFHVHAVVEPKWPIFTTREDSSSSTRRRRLDPSDLHGEISFGDAVRKCQPHVVFVLDDPQNVLHLCTPKSERDYALIIYTNIDGHPCPKGFENLKHADLILTTTAFGAAVLETSYPELSNQGVRVLYPPAMPDLFFPMSASDKLQVRENNFPQWVPRDAFVFGWIGFNQWRKQSWQPYRILSLLRSGNYVRCMTCGRTGPRSDGLSGLMFKQGGLVKIHKMESTTATVCRWCDSRETLTGRGLDNVFAWIHMAGDTPGAPWSLRELEETYNVFGNSSIIYTNNLNQWAHLPCEGMPVLYQLFDCLLYLSGGEGFGMPAWEAIGCGVPVVYTNYSGHAEYLTSSGGGIPVEGVLQPEPGSCVQRMVGSEWQALDAILALYEHPDLGLRLGEKGRSAYVRACPQSGKSRRGL